MPEQEVLVALSASREELRPAATVRSTLIASSLQSLRSRGFYDRYLQLLAPAWKEAILQSVAGVWLPIDAGVAHYAACDALGLSTTEQLAIGREVGQRVQGTFLSTMIRAAKLAGVTPWLALGHTGKLYERLFQGGGCEVVRVATKDARVFVEKNAMFEVEYFRNACRGFFESGLELFCSKAYVTERPSPTPGRPFVLRISWA